MEEDGEEQQERMGWEKLEKTNRGRANTLEWGRARQRRECKGEA